MGANAEVVTKIFSTFFTFFERFTIFSRINIMSRNAETNPLRAVRKQWSTEVVYAQTVIRCQTRILGQLDNVPMGRSERVCTSASLPMSAGLLAEGGGS